jgi:hypothetical protein
VSGTPRPNDAACAGFRIDEAEVIFWGTCPECLAGAPDRSGGSAVRGS